MKDLYILLSLCVHFVSWQYLGKSIVHRGLWYSIRLDEDRFEHTEPQILDFCFTSFVILY